LGNLKFIRRIIELANGLGQPEGDIDLNENNHGQNGPVEANCGKTRACPATTV
jgi:hypothetical protein